jgi:YbbR domain-containing protein
MIAFLRNLIFHDFWLKLLSLVFAVVIWKTISNVFLPKKDAASPITVFGTEVEQTYANVPVLVIFPAAEVRTVSVEPSEVQVTVRGEPEAIRNLNPRDIHAQVDLTGIQSASALRKRIEVTLPSGMIPARVVPDEVEVIIPPR